MKKRTSIVSAFGSFRDEDEASDENKTEEKSNSETKPKRVAAGIIGSTQRTLTQIREERDALMEQVASGNHILQIKPELIVPSPFRDRLPDDNDSDFERFKQSIDLESQKVPITVRQHPAEEGRYQIVYGHRRWRALKELNKDINAVVAHYSDRELVIAQGIENADRQDLTWIEQALFAHEMQSAGIKPRDIKASLSVDDSELSKFRSVIRAVPVELIEKIGRAPAIGRPRWLELSGHMNEESAVSRIKKTLAAAKVSNLSSDEKFVAVLTELTMNKLGQSDKKAQPTKIELGEIGSLSMSNNAVKIKLSKAHSNSFRKFLEREIPDLINRYLEKKGNE